MRCFSEETDHNSPPTRYSTEIRSVGGGNDPLHSGGALLCLNEARGYNFGTTIKMLVIKVL